METLSCLIVTGIAFVFLLAVYILVWCHILKAEEKRTKRQTFYKYFQP